MCGLIGMLLLGSFFMHLGSLFLDLSLSPPFPLPSPSLPSSYPLPSYPLQDKHCFLL